MRKTVLAIALAALAAALPAAAQEPPGGRRGTGLPVPRYVSLKTDRVNLREGPSKDHRTAWVFQRAGLPVEIVAEYEADLVRVACRSEGFDADLTGRIMAQHLSDPFVLDFAEHASDGVGHYVRSLAKVLAAPERLLA